MGLLLFSLWQGDFSCAFTYSAQGGTNEVSPGNSAGICSSPILKGTLCDSTVARREHWGPPASAGVGWAVLGLLLQLEGRDCPGRFSLL